MELRYLQLCFNVLEAVLLLSLISIDSTEAKQCRCSDIQCINTAINVGNSSECCLWDFPPNPAVQTTTEFQEMGYGYGQTTMEMPHFCISYPVDSDNVDMKNYFVIKLDIQGADVCVYESGKIEDKNCSVTLKTMPVKKAVYCSGEPISGAQSVNFSVECSDCSKYMVSFQFQVLSMAFDSEQDKWCESVDTTVPSERHVLTHHTDQPTPTHHEEHNDKGDNNMAHGLTGSVLTSLVLLIAAALVAL